jgi:hypothetical protein
VAKSHSKDIVTAQDIVNALKTELNAAIDRLAAKLGDAGSAQGSIDASKSPDIGSPDIGMPGAVQLFRLDGRTQLVAQYDQALPDGDYKVFITLSQGGTDTPPAKCFVDVQAPHCVCDALHIIGT